MDYSTLLDEDVLAFIKETLSFYPDDLAPDDWPAQRAVYDRMADQFRAARPKGLPVCDDTIAGVPVRCYGHPSEAIILYAHGGGFVLGGLESHDDVCAEIAVASGVQVVSIDYRLAPEHPHPADFEDMQAVAKDLTQQHSIVLCGDSAGATLCASVAGVWHSPRLLGQVLIYPYLGYPMNGGSFDAHANAPLLSLSDLIGFADVRGVKQETARAIPHFGTLAKLPPTFLFPAECDPLHDDALLYHKEAQSAGADIQIKTHSGLVHGWLRARHKSNRASLAFDDILKALKSLVG